MLIEGIGYHDIKQYLMQLHDVTSTELDHGHNIPYSIYCIKPYAKINKQWQPHDTCKIGMATSVAHRVRMYSQPGGNLRTLWTIDVIDKGSAVGLENAIHQFCKDVHEQDDTIPSTELFELTCQAAFTVLVNFINTRIINNFGIIRITSFENNKIDSLTTPLYQHNNGIIRKTQTGHKGNNNYNSLFADDADILYYDAVCDALLDRLELELAA